MQSIQFTLPFGKCNQILMLPCDLLYSISNLIFQEAYAVIDDNIFIGTWNIILQKRNRYASGSKIYNCIRINVLC